MAHISINTSQNVQIDHSVANIGQRILSQIIDLAFIFAYVLIVSLLLSSLSIRNSALLLIMYLPAFFYSFLTETIFQGQSFGKMILKIKVVKIDGSQATLFNYFVRWIFRIIDVIITNGVLAIISCAVSEKGQRIGDKAAGTIVVGLNKKYNFRNTIFRRINDNYQLQFPQVESLTEKDIKTVNEAINHYFKNPSLPSRQLLLKTKEAILQKTGIETSLDSIPFLRTVVNDYNYILRNDEY